MSLGLVFAIALGLAMDAFAVSMACSASLAKLHGRQVFRIAFHFGWFQAMMPVLGWLAGTGARALIERWDHWVAFGLLVLVGGKAIVQALRQKFQVQEVSTPGRQVTNLAQCDFTGQHPEQSRPAHGFPRGLSLGLDERAGKPGRGRFPWRGICTLDRTRPWSAGLVRIRHSWCGPHRLRPRG